MFKKMSGSRKIFTVFIAVCLMITMIPAMTFAEERTLSDDIVILFSGDIHGQVSGNLGLAGLAAYKNEQLTTNKYVSVVDAGDALNGTTLASVSKGSYVIEAMNYIGYTAAVPGVHEFDYGVSRFRTDLTKLANFEYISSNFKTASGSAVFKPYKIVSYGETKVAFIGISDPETMTKSSSSFKNSDGTYAYGFDSGDSGKTLYETVQKSIDAAKAEGASYIVALSHLSTDTAGFYSPSAVIKNTAGINVMINGNSHEAVAGEKVSDKNGNTALITCAGTGMQYIGKLTISGGKTITSTLVGSYALRDITTTEGIKTLTTQYNTYLTEAFATSTTRLAVTNLNGARIIESAETNLGDLCSDAYRIITGADIAFVEAKEIQANILVGGVSYRDVINVLPSGKQISVLEVTGLEILDALEMSSRLYPNKNSGFLQVSGLTYDIQETIIPSVTLDGLGNFMSVNDEYRVTNVMVNGKALDIMGTYKLAATNDFLNGYTGYNMFKDEKIVSTNITTDSQALINYISNNLRGTIGSLYAKSQGRMDAIRLARQSEINLELANRVKEEVADYETQLQDLRKQVEIKDQVIALKTVEVTAASTFTKSKSGKRTVKVTWKANDDISGMKYQVWKSSKKSSGYKRMISTSKLTYSNTSGLTKGKTYYYKVRGYKIIDGKYYYTHWSNITYKKITK